MPGTSRSAGIWREERGVTPIVAAVLIISLVFMAFSVIVTQVVPVYQEKNEANHYHILRQKALDFQSAVLSKSDSEISIPMGPDPAPITGAKSPTEFKARPAKAVVRVPPVEDAYVDQGEPNSSHNESGLWVSSYGPVGPGSKEDWNYPPDGPENDARTFLKFDLERLRQKGVSAANVSEVWLVLFDEYVTKFTYPGWRTPGWNQAGAGPYENYAWNPMTIIPINVEPRTVGDQGWWEEDVRWPGPKLGDTIRELDFPEADNHAVTENQVWMTWGVTSWFRDQLGKGKENVSFCLKAVWENSTQLRSVRFSSKENGARMSTNRGTGHPPYPVPHLTVIYERSDPTTGKPLPGKPVLGYDNWGPFIEGGFVSLKTHYAEFSDYEFTFESGALLSQIYGFTGDLMLSRPGLVVPGSRYDDEEKISIYINRYRIVNWEEEVSNQDSTLVVNVEENEDFYRSGWRENLLITINTDFKWPWKYYFRDLSTRWNTWSGGGGLNAAEDPAEFMAKFYVDRNTRLYLPGPVHGDGSDPDNELDEDIYYVDRTFDVEVRLSGEE